MKKEYLVLTIILAISLIVTLVLLIGTPSFTCKADEKCLDPRLIMPVVSLILLTPVIVYNAVPILEGAEPTFFSAP